MMLRTSASVADSWSLEQQATSRLWSVVSAIPCGLSSTYLYRRQIARQGKVKLGLFIVASQSLHTEDISVAFSTQLCYRNRCLPVSACRSD